MSITVVDASVPHPVLAISRVDVGVLEVTWPTNATDYTLESATSLPATRWSPVTNRIVLNGGRCTVQLEGAGSQQYFRLSK